MKKDQDKLEKQLAETQAENRRLQDPLQKAREELAELHKQLSSYERDKVSLAVSSISLSHSISLPPFSQNAKARLKVQESELKSLRWEHEVLEQRFAQVCYYRHHHHLDLLPPHCRYSRREMSCTASSPRPSTRSSRRVDSRTSSWRKNSPHSPTPSRKR